MRLAIQNETARRVIFTFDNWAKDRGFWDQDHDRTTYTDRGFAHVRLTTRANDWYLNPDLAPVLAVAEAVSRDYDARHGLAFSMGGYGLMLLSRGIAFDQTLFFSPNTSHGFGIGPTDPRFPAEFPQAAFAADTYAAMREGRLSEADCVIAYDPIIPLDAAHALETARFFRRARKMELRDSGHPSAYYIAKGHRWGQVVKAITGDRLRESLSCAPMPRCGRSSVRSGKARPRTWSIWWARAARGERAWR